jgi:glycosyltransferase involved in cell wall biosynthesis
MKDLSRLKVAIVCDWLTGYGGAERVVLELHKMFPSAPIYTSQYDPKKIDWFEDADVRTTWLQKLPTGLRKFFPLLRAITFNKINLKDYDLVISSSGAEAKFVHVKKPTIHLTYCHSPTHYYWIRYDEYMKNPGFGALNWLARIGLRVLVGPMRRWDFKAAQKPNFIIANSTFTKANIKKYYKRDSLVVFPPVDVELFKPPVDDFKAANRTGFVTAGRQTPYKRIDLAVAACTKLNLPLTVIGNGPDHKRLVQMAGPTIKFLTNVSDKDMPGHFAKAQAFIFPGMEDFGIVAVEAMAAGTPVIAYKAGGALDTVVPGEGGDFFEKQTVDSLINALEKFKPTDFYASKVSKHAAKFSQDAFHKKITSLLKS